MHPNEYELEGRVGERLTVIRGHPPNEETTTGTLVDVDEEKIVVKTDSGRDIFIKQGEWTQIKFKPPK